VKNGCSPVWFCDRHRVKYPIPVIPLFLFASCLSYRDIPIPEKGSPVDPIRCEGAKGTRRYLESLRSTTGGKIEYRFDEALLGAEGRPVDRFYIRNPALPERKRSIWSRLRMFRPLFSYEKEEKPAFYRIYIDLYAKKNDGIAPPGYRITE